MIQSDLYSEAPPKYATHEIAGLYYKYGSHGYVFYWQPNKKEWQRSSLKSLQSFNKIGARYD